MRDLLETEDIFIEPSACAAIQGPVLLNRRPETRAYLEAHGLTEKLPQATHILWATGGSLVPQAVREEYIRTHL
jgi:D-serine dehydratase